MTVYISRCSVSVYGAACSCSQSYSPHITQADLIGPDMAAGFRRLKAWAGWRWDKEVVTRQSLHVLVKRLQMCTELGAASRQWALNMGGLQSWQEGKNEVAGGLLWSLFSSQHQAVARDPHRSCLLRAACSALGWWVGRSIALQLWVLL